MWNKYFEDKLPHSVLYILNEFQVFKINEPNNFIFPLELEGMSEFKTINLNRNTNLVTSELSASLEDKISDFFSYFSNNL